MIRAAAPYAIAIAIVAAFFAVAQSTHPYYFLQDDNRDQFLPFFVHNYRAASEGQLAQYNFHQSLGHPHLAEGYTATLHPLPYVAIFLSNRILGHAFGAIDILTLIYLVIAAAGAVALVRMLRGSNAAAVFAATTWALLPFNMHTSQSWSSLPPLIGSLPWMLVAALLIYRGSFVRGGALFVIAHLAVFYSGGQQFLFYAAVVELGVVALTALGESKRIPVGAFAASLAVTIALSAPLLLPMWRVVKESAFRGQKLTSGVRADGRVTEAQLAAGMVQPFRRVYGQTDSWYANNVPPGVTHIGYLAILLLAAYPFVHHRIDERERRVTDACMIVAAICLIGACGWWESVTEWLPVANRFRWPFKLFPFAALPAAVCAAIALDRIVTRRVWLALIVAAQAANLAIVDVTFDKQGFFEHLDPIPIADPLPPQIAHGRILTVTCRPAKPRALTAHLLGYDYATLFRVDQFGGYDPLIPRRNLDATLNLDYRAQLCENEVPLQHLRTWGVQWYLLDHDTPRVVFEQLMRNGAVVAYRDQQRLLLRDPFALPMAGSASCSERGERRIGDDVEYSVACTRADRLTLRHLYNADFVVTVDGKPVPHARNDRDQIEIAVAPGAHAVRLDYQDPLFDAGRNIALIAIGIVVAALIVSGRRASGNRS